MGNSRLIVRYFCYIIMLRRAPAYLPTFGRNCGLSRDRLPLWARVRLNIENSLPTAIMDPTPPVYVFFPPSYKTTPMPPPPPPTGDGQLSPLIIFFIALAALVALLILICLMVMIYNICRYGSCCPPSTSAGNCCCCRCVCTPCVAQPGPIVKQSPVIVQSPSYSTGSYVGRGTRLNQGSYVVAPRTIRTGTLPSRRNSLIVVGRNTVPRRQVIQTARPQILVSGDGCRVPTMGRSSLMALPAPSSSIRCITRNEPAMSGGWNNDDDGEVRVIVRNQPYGASQRRATIIEAPPDSVSFVSPPLGYDNIAMQKTGGMAYGAGIGGLDQGADYGYGFSGQHSATFDVSFDQAPEYTSDDGIQQFQQASIYPVLGETNYY